MTGPGWHGPFQDKKFERVLTLARVTASPGWVFVADTGVFLFAGRCCSLSSGGDASVYDWLVTALGGGTLRDSLLDGNVLL